MYMNDMHHRMIQQRQLSADHVRLMWMLNEDRRDEYDHLQLQLRIYRFRSVELKDN